MLNQDRLGHALRWNELHPEIVQQAKERERAQTRTATREYMRKRRATEPEYKILCLRRARAKAALRVRNAKKADKTHALLGCTPKELRLHLEKQFQPGMTWANHGLYGWHMDHIRPCASFDLTDPEQQRQCFHYTNLQPMWAMENWRKNDLWDGQRHKRRSEERRVGK